MPRPTSSWRKRTVSAATTTSLASASSIDRVYAMPLTAITTGLGACGAHTPKGSKRARPGQRLRPLLGHHRPHLGEIQPAREVLAVPEDHPHPHLGVVRQPLVGRREGVDHLQVEGVSLLRSVDSDQQHRAVALDRHHWLAHARQGPRCAGRRQRARLGQLGRGGRLPTSDSPGGPAARGPHRLERSGLPITRRADDPRFSSSSAPAGGRHQTPVTERPHLALGGLPMAKAGSNFRRLG